MEIRSTSVNMTRFHQPLRGRRLAIRSFSACPLRGGAAGGNDLSLHQRWLNRTPKVTIARAHGGIKDERHGGKEVYLRSEEDS